MTVDNVLLRFPDGFSEWRMGMPVPDVGKIIVRSGEHFEVASVKHHVDGGCIVTLEFAATVVAHGATPPKTA